MREGKPDVLVMDHQNQKPLIKSWLAKQSLPVEAAIVTTTKAAIGAAIGGVFCTLQKAIPSTFPLQPQPIDCAIGMGVNAGILCVLERLRGKEDVYSSMAAAFGSGAILSMRCHTPNPASFAVFNGVFFALASGGFYKLMDLGEESSKPIVEDPLYKETRGMLSSLGLEDYEKNFKRGLLKDTTLPMLTDSVLQEVRIPPGARLLILDHIERRRSQGFLVGSTDGL